jgi:hypothetical protein
MPAASPLEAIETSVAAEIALVPGLSADAIILAPFADHYTQLEDGTVALDEETLPPGYPGVVLSLNDEDITVVIEDKNLGPREQYVRFRVPVFMAVYATSDGSTLTAARYKAWEIAHAIIARLVNFIPSGAPEPWVIEVDEVLEPGALTPRLIDSMTFAILVRFYARYYVVATTPGT